MQTALQILNVVLNVLLWAVGAYGVLGAFPALAAIVHVPIVWPVAMGSIAFMLSLSILGSALCSLLFICAVCRPAFLKLDDARASNGEDFEATVKRIATQMPRGSHVAWTLVSMLFDLAICCSPVLGPVWMFIAVADLLGNILELTGFFLTIRLVGTR